MNSKAHNSSMSSAASEHAVSYAMGVETMKSINDSYSNTLQRNAA